MKCLLPSQIEKFKEALKDKDIKLSDFLKEDLSHEQVVEKVKPFAGVHAEDVANLIESKLILKNKAIGLRNAFDKLAQTHRWSPEEIAKQKERLSDYRAKQQERIFNPKQHESYLSGLVERELGFKAPQNVAKKVFDLTQEVSKAKEVEPTALGVSDEYFKAKDNLDRYVESQKPLDVRVAIAKNIAIIGRNNLILGLSTPLKTSVGQATNSALDMFTRRIGIGEFAGANPELKNEVFKEVQKTFAETGRNGLGMESLDDAHFLGFGKKAEDFALPQETGKTKASLGENIEKVTAKTAEISQYIAINLEHQIPFTKFYQKAWLDMADLMSTKIAKSQGAEDVKGRAGEIFKDAVKIEPETPEGIALRKACQAQAARVTSTNENALANYSLGIKKILNNIVPIGEGKHFPLGDFLVPMAKIPATVISNMVENAGVGIPFGIRDVLVGKDKIASDDLETRLQGLTQYAQGVQKLARIAGSLTLGAVLVNSIDKKDLKSDQWGNHFFRIGNTWINTEYLSFLSAGAGGMMEMKLGHAKTALGTAGEYVEGVSKSLTSLPWNEEVKQVIDNMRSGHFIHNVMRSAEEFVTSRAIPAVVQDIFKHAQTMPWFGPNTRPVDRLFFGAHGVESTEDVHQDKIEQKQKVMERKREAREE
jgi:hypothetical protein